jgi:hypothetical protein
MLLNFSATRTVNQINLIFYPKKEERDKWPRTGGQERATGICEYDQRKFVLLKYLGNSLEGLEESIDAIVGKPPIRSRIDIN